MKAKNLRLENEVGSQSRRDEQVARSDGGEGGGGRHATASPSFLVLNKDNVNAEAYRAEGLLAMWDFLVYKGRIGRTHVLLSKRDEPSALRIMPAGCRNSYFTDGRLYVASRACQHRHYTRHIQSCFTRATRGSSGEV